MGVRMKRDLSTVIGKRLYVTTLYFESPWAKGYEFTLTGKDEFFTEAGTVTSRSYMEVEKIVRCIWTELFQVIFLPYHSRNPTHIQHQFGECVGGVHQVYSPV